MNRVHVLHVIQRLSRGGAARSLINLAQAARTGPFQHQAVSLLDAGQKALELAQAAGLPVLVAPTQAALRRAVAAADIVLVHFWNTPELYAWLCADDQPPMRLLLWCHVAGDHAPQVITPALLDYADFALASSPYTLDLPVFRTAPPAVRAKTGVIAAVADLARLANVQPKPHAGFNVGYIGTVDFVKLHPNYVPMSAEIDIPDVRFIVCGDGGSLALLRKQAEQLGVADRFDWRGYVDDLEPVLEYLDLFGYPLCEDNYSTAELILQEVMAAGVPPVIFAHGGAQRVVRHNETGLIVHSAGEYKQAVEYLYRHPAERLRLGRNAQGYARRVFDANETTAQFNRLFDRLLAQPKTTRRWPAPAPGSDLALCGVQTTHFPGAVAFIRSLGDTAPHFAASLTADAWQDQLAAERRIAHASPVLCNVGGGGILHYRLCYPHDGYLHLWAGLVLEQQGRPALAVAEFSRARQCGCDHWRVAWYLAQAAAAAGARQLAGVNLQTVLATQPAFEPALAMQQRLAAAI